MSSINFQCRYCRQTRAVASSRIFENGFIRCDNCQAVNGLSESERLRLSHDASTSAAKKRTRPHQSASY